MTFNPIEKSVIELQVAMEEGELSSVALTNYYLNRIDALDKKGPKLNAVVTINKSALEEAIRLDELRQTHGKLSELHGIPVIIKDNMDTFDMPTTASSQLMADNRPTKDAFIVKKLRDAGAIIIAKSNLSEFACHGFTDGTLIGQTLNPYDLSRTPGGSSGGTCVAVSANYAVCGLGTDTVNSVRSPASATNLVGFRPSTGLFSRAGIIPVSETQDTAGTLTRCVTDAAVLFDICYGFDPDDHLTAEQPLNRSTSFIECLKVDGLQNKRLGVITNLVGKDEAVLEIMASSVDRLREHGAEVIFLEIPEFDMMRLNKEADVQYFEFKRQMDQYFDSALNCPVPNFQYLADSGKLHPAIAKFIIECAKVEHPLASEEYKRRLLNNVQNRRLAYYLMAKHDIDAFVYPHQSILVQPISEQSQQGRNGLLASTIGFPAITVPGGFSAPNDNAPKGVPVGIEFMARRFDEAKLFEIAYGFEQARNNRRIPPFAL